MSKMWGGRFSRETNPLVEEFTKSIQFDRKLARYDCIGSIAHIKVLKKAKLLSTREYRKLEAGLKSILASIKRGDFKIDPKFEDIHSYIQNLLERKVGKVALKFHTYRSRNDQVVFDTKMYCLENALTTGDLILILCKKIMEVAKKNKAISIPGYTHLQHAMPLDLSDYFGAYINMFFRDTEKLATIFKTVELTLGAGALAGTPISSSIYNVAMKPLFLKYKHISPTPNPVYTVSDRDFVIESLMALAITGMHLSRLAEDLILWSTKEFDFIDIDEAFCTGSSLMPQKKNPDVLELMRGNAGKLYGNLMSALVMMKGLPLSYNRDMQLDKEPLFDSFGIIQSELKLMAAILPAIKFKKKNIEKQLQDECLYATDMADYLVKNKVPFKHAHAIIGKLIKYKLNTGKEIKKMEDAELKRFHPALTNKVMKKIIDPKASIRTKKSIRRRTGKI